MIADLSFYQVFLYIFVSTYNEQLYVYSQNVTVVL